MTGAVDSVAADLRRLILEGDPAPGRWLREQALAARYGVARHTVRAALRALAAENLVVVETNRGARVASLDGAELAALFELRTALEVEAARLLGQRHGLGPWPPEVLAAAEALDAACDRAEPDRVEVDAAHAALHHALVAAARSPRITAAHAALAAESRVVLLQSRGRLPVAGMSALHRDLLDALHTAGPDALRDHLGHGEAAGRQA